ncbi:unnamed protein product, partial [Mesorhabditis belari]|uniref:Uncharacterized protein n=1 Tax=Mesorhabditis belari TaxID=2138241 RepID=A0AAF3EI66_9BILA
MVQEIRVSLPFEPMNTQQFQAYWHSILKKPILQEASYLDIVLLEQLPSILKDFPTNAKHFELNSGCQGCSKTDPPGYASFDKDHVKAYFPSWYFDKEAGASQLAFFC